MTQEKAQLDRRSFLRGSLAAAALVPLAGTLASCSSPSSDGGGGGGGTKSATNPFGLAKSSSVEAVIFNGGYGYDYVKYAADQVNEAEGLLGRQDQGVSVDADRPAAAASLRRRHPARPDRQLGCERHRLQRHREAVRDARRRVRGEQLRGHQDRGHALPEREGPGHLRRQVHRDELRDDGLRRLVLRVAVQGERLDRAGDVGRRTRSRRQGQGQGQVPLRLGQGGGDVLPDDVRQLRHQGGRRRGPPRAGEPRGEVLVDAAAPVRVQGPRRDGVEGLLRPRRCRHPVHRRPGEVEQRRTGGPLPVRRLDRERDEVSDEVGLRDDRCS